MKPLALIAALVGLAAVTGLIAYHGADEVMAALTVAGWGVAVVAAFHLVPMAADAAGWWTLLRRKERPPFAVFLWGRWLGESVNGLLPVAQVGGDVVRARVLMYRGISGPVAGASVVVDLTLSVVSQVAFTLAGIGILVVYLGGGLGGGNTLWAALVGVAVSTLLVAGFYAAQRRGLFGRLAGVLERVGGGVSWLQLAGGARALDAAIATCYGRRRAVIRGFLWRLLGWGVGVGEVWLALHFLGVPIGWAEAFLLESLAQAVRAAAFLIPGALGVQEGGFLLLGGLLGIAPESALALALIRRMRELSLGLPGLVAWQMAVGRRAWRVRAGDMPDTDAAKIPTPAPVRPTENP